MKRKFKGDVQWFDTPTSKRAFASSTRADSETIASFSYLTPKRMRVNVPYLSQEVVYILDYWIAMGKGNSLIRDILNFKG